MKTFLQFLSIRILHTTPYKIQPITDQNLDLCIHHEQTLDTKYLKSIRFPTLSLTPCTSTNTSLDLIIKIQTNPIEIINKLQIENHGGISIQIIRKGFANVNRFLNHGFGEFAFDKFGYKKLNIYFILRGLMIL